MSRFFPHTQYAEDQPLSRTILITHVLFRGFQSGAGIGATTGAVKALLTWRASRSALAANPASSTTTTATSTLSTAGRAIASSISSQPQPLKSALILRSTGTGALIGTGLMVVGLPFRMKGREDIEWSDRSWRLLQNAGQVECDDWSAIGTVVGAAAALRSSGSIPRRLLGGAGVGSFFSIGGYMIWRYGVNGGKF